MVPLVYYTLHGARSHLLRLGRRRHCPPIVKIRCTTHNMGLAPNNRSEPEQVPHLSNDVSAIYVCTVPSTISICAMSVSEGLRL